MLRPDEISLTVGLEDHEKFKRLDHFLSDKIKEYSRSFIKNLFLKGLIEWDLDSPFKEKKLELKKMPPVGSIINIQIPPPIPSTAKAENLPLEILYEDEHLVFVNKPAGMVTHPAPGNYTGTLVNAILHHCPDLSGIGGQLRPGIVHRLDKGTSGVMVVAKSQAAHEGLVLLFSTHKIERVYETLVLGTKMPSEGTIQSTIGRHKVNRLKMAAHVKQGRNAITHYEVINFYKKLSYLKVTLETGRTHQIRVHLSSILKKPILCDPLYGNPKEHLKHLGGKFNPLLKNYPHPLLHAKILGLVHPITGKKLRFKVKLPDVFQQTIELAEIEI